MNPELVRDFSDLVAAVINLFAAAQDASNVNHIHRLTKLLTSVRRGIIANRRMLDNSGADACAALEAVYESQDPGDMQTAVDSLKSLAHIYKQYKGCKKEAEFLLKKLDDLE